MMRLVLVSFLSALARHRLVHFLLVGGVLALAAPKEQPATSTTTNIQIDSRRLEESLRAEEIRLGRVLSPAEAERIRRETIDDEVLAREALRAGVLDRELDPVVRGRLAERMRAVLASTLPPPQLDEREIDVATSRAIEGAPERVRLALWFVSREHPDAGSRAEEIVRAIREHGYRSPQAKRHGDHLPVPDGAIWTEEALARALGGNVARAAMTTNIDAASLPLPSAWGFYVLVPLERRRAEPAEVRAEAIATLTREKQSAALDVLIERARRSYTITDERSRVSTTQAAIPMNARSRLPMDPNAGDAR